MNQEKFFAWEEKKHIPEEVKRIVRAVFVECGICDPFPDDDEETIRMHNRGGWLYAVGKGLTLMYRTSSMEDGPDADPRYLVDFIKGLGFVIKNSHGDNGLDGATNWHDTYWQYDVLYKPSLTYIEEFEEYD